MIIYSVGYVYFCELCRISNLSPRKGETPINSRANLLVCNWK